MSKKEVRGRLTEGGVMDKRTFFLIGVTVALGLLSFAVDDQAVRFFAGVRTPILNEFMIVATNLLTVAIIAILIPVLLLWVRDGKRWILPLVLSVVVAVGLTYVFKGVVARPRPGEGLIPETGFSFPSGHAATAFSIIPAFGRRFSRMKWLWVGFACFVGLTRLYVGVHNLSDVIFGGLLGYLTGLAITLVGAWRWKKSG